MDAIIITLEVETIEMISIKPNFFTQDYFKYLKTAANSQFQ